MRTKQLMTVAATASAVLFGTARLVPGHEANGPVLTAATTFVRGTPESSLTAVSATPALPGIKAALGALASSVHKLSHPRALEDAFQSYFAYRAAHPNDVKRPYLYFVDYGLPSTTPRGYVFDMDELRVVDGPFTVAHGRGSSTSQYGVPTRFSNASGSATTSLGLFLTQELYSFRGHSGGRTYTSVGLRLAGVSGNFNDNARDRGVVTHGAPYVTPTKAGRSEGCPAMELSRAERLLPKLANGAMVFLFAPNEKWMAGDPWLAPNSSATDDANSRG
jgi:hypothetical protein